MPAHSTKMALEPAIRRRLEEQLEFIAANKDKVPGLIRSVAEIVGCSPANVYSVFRGSTWNAGVIREAYAQVCRFMGVLEPDTMPDPDRPLDDQALSYVARAREGRHNLKQLLLEFRDLNNRIKRASKDLRVLEGTMELFLRWNLEDISDMIAVQLKEHLTEVGFTQPTSMPTQAVDTDDIPDHIREAMAVLQASGALTAEGFLAEETEEEAQDDFEVSESGDYVVSKN
jgi:hypothetical protein